MKRQPRLFRAIFVVLALGAAVVAVRCHSSQAEIQIHLWNRAATRFPPVRNLLPQALRLAASLRAGLLVLTIGVGALALRRHRRASWPGRGRMALLAANLGLGWGLLNLGADWAAAAQNWQWDWSLTRTCEMFASYPAPWIVGAWACLAYAGHWRLRRTPLDGPERVGRAIGWAWLILLLCSWVERAL